SENSALSNITARFGFTTPYSISFCRNKGTAVFVRQNHHAVTQRRAGPVEIDARHRSPIRFGRHQSKRPVTRCREIHSRSGALFAGSGEAVPFQNNLQLVLSEATLEQPSDTEEELAMAGIAIRICRLYRAEDAVDDQAD